MRKQTARWRASLCPATLEEVAALVRGEADQYGDLARERWRRRGGAATSLAAADADAQSRALHHLARTLEYMASRSAAERR